jgi:hypothetical protein
MLKDSDLHAPRSLLQAWVWMVTQSNDEQIIHHATSCLAKELGSEYEAQKYIERNKVLHTSL